MARSRTGLGPTPRRRPTSRRRRQLSPQTKARIRAAAKWAGTRTWRATRRAVGIAGRYAKTRGRRAVLAVEQFRTRRVGAKSTRKALVGPAYTCSECPTWSTHDQAEFAAHMRSHGALFAKLADKPPAKASTTVPAASSAETKPAAAATLTDKPHGAALARKARAADEGYAAKLAAHQAHLAAARKTREATAAASTPSTISSTATTSDRDVAVRDAASTSGSAPNTTRAERAARYWSRSNGMTNEVHNLVRAAQRISDMEITDAMQFDELLGAFAAAWPRIGDALAQFAEQIDTDLGLDPVVTRPLYEAADSAGDVLGQAFGKAKQAFRT
ncbi:MAG TPA: hypothetical protein VGJ44_20240, partial [Kribbellaceae bacterium]